MMKLNTWVLAAVMAGWTWFTPLSAPAAEPPDSQSAKTFRTLVMFTASWCPNCVATKPTVAKLQREGYAVEIVDIDTDEGKRLAADCKVRTIPTFITREDRAVVARMISRTYKNKSRLVGRQSEKELREFLGKQGIAAASDPAKDK